MKEMFGPMHPIASNLHATRHDKTQYQLYGALFRSVLVECSFCVGLPASTCTKNTLILGIP